LIDIFNVEAGLADRPAVAMTSVQSLPYCERFALDRHQGGCHAHQAGSYGWVLVPLYD